MCKVREQNVHMCAPMCVCARGCPYFMCVHVWTHVIVCAFMHEVSVCDICVYILVCLCGKRSINTCIHLQ